MEFRFLDTEINGLTIDLEVLIPDSNQYSTILFQHKGTFAPTAQKFGNHTSCENEFNRFFNHAKAENAALAVTPEYSCPWESIEWVLSNTNRWPNLRKLWTIGCESITPAGLNSLRETFSDQQEIVFVYDQTAFNNGAGDLVDPLCYIFRGEIAGVSKLMVVVQFKTQHMGVWENNIEQTRLIWGNYIYVLKNNINSIYLFTLICSEAANFVVNDAMRNQVDNRWDLHPYLIINPQMNPKPSAPDFQNFRNTIYRFERKDLISLNWAGGTLLNGKAGPWIPHSKSAVVVKSSEVEYGVEARFLNNHKKGLYYLLRKPNVQVNYLHPGAHIFLINNIKPWSGNAPLAMVRRIGPVMDKVLEWSGPASDFVELAEVDDCFCSFLTGLHCTDPIYHDATISFIDKERLIGLSSGNIRAKPEDRNWHELNKLNSIQHEDENCKRLTYIFDETSEILRSSYVTTIDSLTHILTRQDLFPDILQEFFGNCNTITFSRTAPVDTRFKFNLITADLTKNATGVFIGRSNEGAAQRICHRVQEIFNSGDPSRKKVVVWYKETEVDIRWYCDPSPPTVSDDPAMNSNLIF